MEFHLFQDSYVTEHRSIHIAHCLDLFSQHTGLKPLLILGWYNSVRVIGTDWSIYFDLLSLLLQFASDTWFKKFFWVHHFDIAESCDWYCRILWFSSLIYSNSGGACWHYFTWAFFKVNTNFQIPNVVQKATSWISLFRYESYFSVM